MFSRFRKARSPSKTKTISSNHLSASSQIGDGIETHASEATATEARLTELEPALSRTNITSHTNRSEKVNSYGMTVLYDPMPQKEAIVDIVFIHGLTGSASKTWMHKDSGVHWPRDLLKQDITDARIMTFGYDVDLVNLRSHAAQDSISGYAHDLLGSLLGYREGYLSFRDIKFVVHSLGGLVLERALVISRNSNDLNIKAIEVHTSRIIFLGTPHHGSASASWGHRLVRMINMFKPVNRNIIVLLKQSSTILGDIQHEFHQFLEKRKEMDSKVAIVCFYETIPVVLSCIVPKESAIIRGEPHYPIRANHMDMTKFSDRRDKGYRDIIREIRTDPFMKYSLYDAEYKFYKFWARLKENSMDTNRHLDLTSIPQEGTFTWIYECLTFQKLSLTETTRVIHITGMPGCGKTVLSAWLFRRYLNAADQGKNKYPRVIFYGFNGRDASRRSVQGMLSSLLHQMFSSVRLLELLKQYSVSTSWTEDGYSLPPDNLETLMHIFRWACKLYQLENTICIIDALDECDQGAQRDKSVDCLTNIFRNDVHNKFIIIVTSRDYWDITFEPTRHGLESVTRLNLDEEKAMQTDLRAYTERSVKDFINKRPLYSSYENELVDRLYNRAGKGMFLLVKLLIDLLYRSVDSSLMGIRRIIDTLPSTIQEVYQEIWQAIPPENELRARQIMCWILTTFRPIAVQTLADGLAHEAVLSDILNDKTDEISLADARAADLEGDLRRLFGPLIRITDGTVELVHQTAKEFFFLQSSSQQLQTQYPVLSADRHIDIASVCLFCLGRNKQSVRADIRSLDSTLGVGVPPFFAYAQKFCLDHRKAAAENHESNGKIERFDLYKKRTFGDLVAD